MGRPGERRHGDEGRAHGHHDTRTAHRRGERRAQQSQNVVDSYERHKANLELFDQIMREISPAYAGQAQRDEDMQKLREEVGQLRQMQAEFLSMKSSLDAFLKSQTPSKTSK